MSNNLAQIYATSKSANKYIVLESDNVEVSGNFYINGTNSRMPAEFENSIRNYLPLTYGTTDSNATTLFEKFDDLSQNVLKQRKDASFNNLDVSGNFIVRGNFTTSNVGNHTISKMTLVGNEIKKHEDPDATSFSNYYKKGKWHNWYHNGSNQTYPANGDFGYGDNTSYTYYTTGIQLYNGYDQPSGGGTGGNGINTIFPPNNNIGTVSNSTMGALESGDTAFCLNTYYHLNTFTGFDLSYANKAWCPWTGFDICNNINNDNNAFLKADTYGIEVQKSGYYNVIFNTQWDYTNTTWQGELGFDKIGLVAVLLKNPGRSNQSYILTDEINESISSLRKDSTIWSYPASYYSGDLNYNNIYLEEGESIGVGYLGFLYDEYRTDKVNNFGYHHVYHRYSKNRKSLNTIGWYGWNRRQSLIVDNILLNKFEVQTITTYNTIGLTSLQESFNQNFNVRINSDVSFNSNVDICGNLEIQGSLGVLNSSTNDITYGTTGSVLTSNGPSASPSWNEPYLLRVYCDTIYQPADNVEQDMRFWSNDTDFGTTNYNNDFTGTGSTVGEWTCPTTGFYKINIQAVCSAPLEEGNLTRTNMYIYKDTGSGYTQIRRYMFDVNRNNLSTQDVYQNTPQINTLIQMNAGDKLKGRILLDQRETGDARYVSAGKNSTFWEIHRVA